MRRGEVWWAELPPPIGRRPVLLLSRNEAYAVRSRVTVAPVTTRRRGIPVEVELGPRDGLPKPCVVNLDDLVTLGKDALSAPITLLGRPKMLAVDAALIFALGIRGRGN